MPPARRRIAPHEGDVAIERYVNDTGPAPGLGRCPWFGDTAGHETIEAAREQWRRVRREAWSGVHVFRLPTAAQQYDGFTSRARELLWASWTAPHFDALALRAALQADRGTVARFLQDDPAGAHQIADVVCTWIECLDTIEACIEACAAHADDVGARLGLGIHKRISSSRRYGDEARDAT